MLLRSSHPHVAFRQFPFRENRLAYLATSTGSDDDANNPETERLDAFANHIAEQANLEKQAKAEKSPEEEVAEQNELAALADTKRRVYEQIPRALLSTATVDTLQAVAQTLGVKLGNVSRVNVDSMIEEKAGEKDKPLTSEIASQVIAALEEQMRQHDLLKKKLQQRATSRHVFSLDTLDAFEKEEARRTAANEEPLESWLLHATTDSMLGLCDEQTKQLFAGASELEIRNYLRGMLDLRRRIDAWNGQMIDNNPRLRKKLEEGASLHSIQQELQGEISTALPELNNVLRTVLKEDVQELQLWIEEAKDEYRARVRSYEGNTESTVAAYDQRFIDELGASESAIKAELHDAERIALEGIQTINSSSSSAEFYAQAQQTAQRIRERCKQPNGEKRDVLEGPRFRQQEAEDWGQEISPVIDDILSLPATERARLESIFGPTVFRDIESVQDDIRSGINGFDYTPRRRDLYTFTFQALQQSSLVDSIEEVDNEKLQNLSHEVKQRWSAEEAIINDIRSKLQTVVEDLISLPLVHTGPALKLGLVGQIRAREATLDKHLEDKLAGRLTNISEQRIRSEVEALQQASEMIQQLADTNSSNVNVYDTADDYVAATSNTSVRAFYQGTDNSIHINRAACPDEATFELVLREEQFHGVVNALSKPFPFFVQSRLQILKAVNEDEDTSEILESVAEDLHVDYQDILHQKDYDSVAAKQAFEEVVTEEGFIWYMNQRERIEQGSLSFDDLPPHKQKLYQLFDTTMDVQAFQQVEDIDPIFAKSSLPREGLEIALANAGDESASSTPADGEEGVDGNDESNTATAVADADENQEAENEQNEQDIFGSENEESAESAEDDSVLGKLDAIEKGITDLESFMEAEPANSGNLSTMIPKYKNWHSELYTIYVKKELSNGKPIKDPDSNPQFISFVNTLKSEVDEANGDAQKLQIVLRDASHARPRSVKKLRAMFWDDVSFMSPLDIYYMVKDGIDDVVRMWQRKSTKNRSRVGARLFGIIPENPIPGLHYLGRLKHDYARREEEKENEEVDVWRKALETKDAFELQGMLETVKQQDQLKAILYLLADKGRIDWDDKNLWTALEKISIYNMPRKACERDMLTRDAWLKKLVTQIWDRDLYLELRSTNDSKYKSAKDDYNNIVDTYAHTGTMGDQLSHILSVYHDCKANNKPMPDEVNPHLYEKIVDYAMNAGKMRMADKLFYIVKGIESGLLPLERMQILINEVLQNFPFMEYFSGQNNSLEDIKKIAKQITDPENPYETSSRTNYWIHSVLMRDFATLSRITKFTSKTGAENIDHEDWPTIFASADYGNINEYTGVISGSRLKMTPEAMKNVYAGFGSRFKVLGHKAQLSDEDEDIFTDTDIEEFSKAILAYLHYDNIITKNGSDGKPRAEMEWNTINTSKAPSLGSKVVGQVRKENNGVVSDLFRAMEAEGLELNWSSYGVSKEMYLQMMTSDGYNKEKADRQKVFDATQFISRDLPALLKRKPEVVKKVLQKHADNLTYDNDWKMDKSDARKYYSQFSRRNRQNAPTLPRT